MLLGAQTRMWVRVPGVQLPHLLDGLNQGHGLAGARRPEHEEGGGARGLVHDGLDSGQLLGVAAHPLVEAFDRPRLGDGLEAAG